MEQRMQQDPKTADQIRTISKPEDLIIRQWIRKNYKVRVSQYALWKMTPAEAVEYLKEINRSAFSKITVADIIEAARREE